MITMLKQQSDSKPDELLTKIQQSEKLISQRFDSVLHPKIVENLSNSIQKLTKSLQSGNSSEKTKEQTESDAKLFDKMRQTMSTKEFVEQYDAGISND
jgi:ketol-acid reductoisomerase